MSGRKATKPDQADPSDLPATIEAATREAIERSDWITPSDVGAQQLALKLARDLDRLGPDEAGQLAALARTFLTTLGQLGLTVTSRRDVAATPNQQEDPLVALRARAEARLTDPQGGDTASVRQLPRR